MDRILAMSLVGAGPGNVFGPGMSAGALESFGRPAGRARTERSGGRGGAAARGARSASAEKCGADQIRTGAAEADGAGGQEGGAAGADAARYCPAALDRGFCFDAVVAPY